MDYSGKVFIATPFYEMKGWSPYISSLMETVAALSYLGIAWYYYKVEGDSYVDRAKNTIYQQFLESDATDIVTVDSDMQWSADGFIRLLTVPDNVRVIGGAYPMKNNWGKFTAYPLYKDGKITGVPLQDGSALIEAESLSGGFLRVQRGALEDYIKAYPDDWYRCEGANFDKPDTKYPNFFETHRPDHRYGGEDHRFCQKLRDMGERLWIEPNIQFGHYGTHGWYGNFHEFLTKGLARVGNSK